MCYTFYPCKEPVQVGVYWRGSRHWHMYDISACKAILQGLLAGKNEVPIGNIKSTVYPDGAPYYVNLKELNQYNELSGQARKVLIVYDAEVTAATKESLQP